MKFSTGTASSNMEFEESLKLIKSSLLYADEIELIGMAEYAVFNYLPKCLTEAYGLAEQLTKLNMALEPIMRHLKKKNIEQKKKLFVIQGLQTIF